MDFLDPRIDEYAAQHTAAESEVLAGLNRETWAKVLMPRMLSGHIQGRVLSMFSKMIRPKNILEIGTYTGYSAICLAEGLAEGGQLHTIDINEELEPMIKRYIKEAGLEDRITTHIGNALDIVPSLEVDFDLVFIDADKDNYYNYYNMLIDRMKPGSYLVADNVLWSGKVLDDPSQMDEETKALHEYNQKLHADPRVEVILIPIRDGLNVARVK